MYRLTREEPLETRLCQNEHMCTFTQVPNEGERHTYDYK